MDGSRKALGPHYWLAALYKYTFCCLAVRFRGTTSRESRDILFAALYMITCLRVTCTGDPNKRDGHDDDWSGQLCVY